MKGSSGLALAFKNASALADVPRSPKDFLLSIPSGSCNDLRDDDDADQAPIKIEPSD